MGGRGERGRGLREERGGKGGAENAGEKGAGPGRSEAVGEHSSTENRFFCFIAMQRRPNVAHFCFNS